MSPALLNQALQVKEYRADRPDTVIRVHKIPRRKMYVPTVDGEDLPPVPISSIDVTRRTGTNLDNACQADIGDVW